MILMILIVTNATDHTVLQTLWLYTDQTQCFSGVVLSLLALWIFEGMAGCAHLIKLDNNKS